MGLDNPLRQVIVNTHSPLVVAQVHDDELLVAEPSEMLQGGRRFIRVAFRALPETWRVRDRENAGMSLRGKLLV